MPSKLPVGLLVGFAVFVVACVVFPSPLAPYVNAVDTSLKVLLILVFVSGFWLPALVSLARGGTGDMGMWDWRHNTMMILTTVGTTFFPVCYILAVLSILSHDDPSGTVEIFMHRNIPFAWYGGWVFTVLCCIFWFWLMTTDSSSPMWRRRLAGV